jgi:hypothetical protein
VRLLLVDHHAPIAATLCHKSQLLYLIIFCQLLRLETLDQLLTQLKDQQLDRSDLGGRIQLLDLLAPPIDENLPYPHHGEDVAGCALLSGVCYQRRLCRQLILRPLLVEYQRVFVDVARGNLTGLS